MTVDVVGTLRRQSPFENGVQVIAAAFAKLASVEPFDDLPLMESVGVANVNASGQNQIP